MRRNQETQAIKKMKCFNMYKHGHSYQEIANHFKISYDHAVANVIGYTDSHHINMDEVYHERATLKNIEDSLNKKKPANNSEYSHSEPLVINNFIVPPAEIAIADMSGTATYIFEQPKRTWFQKAKSFLYKTFFFWK